MYCSPLLCSCPRALLTTSAQFRQDHYSHIRDLYFLQAERPQLSQPVMLREVLQL